MPDASLEKIVRFFDPDPVGSPPSDITDAETQALDAVNRRVAGRAVLGDVLDFVFESTASILPCDRISVAFIDDSGGRIASHWTRARYEPVLLGPGYSERLDGSTLGDVLDRGVTRIIDDLELYHDARPKSASTRVLVREGVRSSLTCPLVVDGRRVGVLFRSCRRAAAYTERHVRLHDMLALALGQAVEAAYRIERLDQAIRAYNESLAFVTHELKSPVASILSDADVLLAGYLGETTDAQRQRLLAMRRKGVVLLDLVRDYLDLARVEGGLTPKVKTGVDVAFSLVDLAVDLTRPQFEERGMRLTIAREGAPPVACDPDLVRIVLVNLVSNAIKYGREGGEVRISARALDGGLEVEVWNEGTGWDQSQRGRLFRRFGRLDDPEHKKRGGSGVGLYTCWRIARLHGGRIDADSEHGAWAKFTFWLPGTPPVAES